MQKLISKNDTAEFIKLYESIYDGYVDGDKNDDKEDKDEDKEKDSSEKEESDESSKEKEEKEDKDEEESDDDSRDDEESEEKDSSDDSDDEGSENEEVPGSKTIQSKVKNLQKQYEDLIVTAFETYTSCCVQKALEESEGSFGENIIAVVDKALDLIKDKVLAEFGVEAPKMGAMIGPITGDATLAIGPEEESGEEVEVQDEPVEKVEDEESENEESDEKE